MKWPWVALRAKPSVQVEGQLSVTEVVDEFYEFFATEESGRYWWWCQMVLLEPDELIVNDSYDNLYRVPFTLTSEEDSGQGIQDVEFGEPIAIRIRYEDIPQTAARAEIAQAACTAIAQVRGEKVAAQFDKRAVTRPQPREGGRVDLKTLRAKLNLPDTATDEEVLAAAEARLEAEPGESQEGEPGTGGGSEEQPTTPPEGGEEPPEGGEPEATAQASVVSIDRGTLTELQQQAKDGADARAEQIRAEDDRILTAAVQAGKFPPARREHWAKLLKADREGTLATIKDLEENTIPVHARGNASSSGEGSEHDGGVGYPASWLPDVQARKQRLAAGERSRVTVGD